MTARRRMHRDEAGITVVEMTVVVALLALALAMAFEGLNSYQAATSGSAARLRNLEEARLIMAVLTRDLRTATSFSSLAPADVSFLGHLNTTATGPPNRIRLYVDGQGRLLEAVTPPDNPTANPITYTGVPTTRVVGEGVVNSGSLLEFRDAADAATTSTTEVASVVVTLSVNLPAATAVPPTVLSSRVFLPNVAAAGAGA
jgi:type II secretory pathway pseudopilin PulG